MKSLKRVVVKPEKVVKVEAKRARILEGDCLEVVARARENSFDAIATDPPYHLTKPGKKTLKANGKGFMNRAWDGGDISFRPETWAALLRVAKPGAYLASFGGPRTSHRIACAIEDAGWEIRDTLQWLYTTGFPKSRNPKGDHEGYGTALKPAYEPIILARKPFVGSVDKNLTKWGVGALKIDASRIVYASELDLEATKSKNPGREDLVTSGVYGDDRPQQKVSVSGRWPTNVLLDEEIAEAIGERRRFFFCTKTTRREREEGLEDFEPVISNDGRKKDIDNPYLRGETTRRNVHPTVKPIALMRWILRLISPSGGYVLDPFVGSGTTGIAALAEGLRFVGIEGANSEREPFVEIARRRLERWESLLS